MIDSAFIEIKQAVTPEEIAAIRALRHRVFIEEQGVPEDEEYDEYDDAATHAVALREGIVIGTGRVFRDAAGLVLIGRMAVDPGWRRHGVGGRVLRFLEEHARDQGHRRVSLHAQTYVKAFYAGHGYREEGDVFMEAGIEHVMMCKDL